VQIANKMELQKQMSQLMEIIRNFKLTVIHSDFFTFSVCSFLGSINIVLMHLCRLAIGPWLLNSASKCTLYSIIIFIVSLPISVASEFNQCVSEIPVQ
jgi:hypothetical protein